MSHKKLTRDQHKLMEGLLDGDLSVSQEKDLDSLMADDAFFQEEAQAFQMLQHDLRFSLKGEEPPLHFDRRVLMATLTEAPVTNLAGTAVKMYMTLCALLAAVVFSLTAVLFRGQDMEAQAASGISGLVQGALGLASWVGAQLVLGVQSTVEVLTPVTSSLRPIVNGLAKAGSAAGPALLPYAVVFLVLTSVALVWGYTNHKRSTPHATLVL